MSETQREQHTLELQFKRYDIWRREGAYVDMWSTVHVLSGTIAGLFPLFIPLGFWVSITIATIAFILWEIFERFILQVGEVFSNQVADVVFGILGFVMTYFLIGWLTDATNYSIFAVLWAITLTLSAFGWWARAKAERIHLEKLRINRESLREQGRELREEIRGEREKLRKLRTGMKEEFTDFRHKRKQKKSTIE